MTEPGPEMVRSQEELVIATELVETGRARLVKRVEVETVTRTIELRREVLEIERIEPGADAGSAQPGASEPPAQVLLSGPLAPGSFRDGSREIVLMQEEAVITTQLVPRERVRLAKQVVTEERTLDADLRAERIDLEHRAAQRGANHDAPSMTPPPRTETK